MFNSHMNESKVTALGLKEHKPDLDIPDIETSCNRTANFDQEKGNLQCSIKSTIKLERESLTSRHSNGTSSRKEPFVASLIEIYPVPIKKQPNNDQIVFQQGAFDKENLQVEFKIANKQRSTRRYSIAKSFNIQGLYRYLFDNQIKYSFTRTVIRQEIYSNKKSIQFIIQLKLNQVEWFLQRTLVEFRALFEYYGMSSRPPIDELSTKKFFKKMVTSPSIRNTKAFQKFINLNKQKDLIMR